MNDETDYLAEGRQVFVEESSELLQQAEYILLKLEDEPDNDELINDLFRTIHTIKGSAGLFGFDDVVAFTHVAESVMDQLRDKEIFLNDDLMGLLLDSRDQISQLVAHALDNAEVPIGDSLRETGEELLKNLHQYLDIKTPNSSIVITAESELKVLTESEIALELTEPESEKVTNDYWHISIRFNRNVLANGMDPLSFFRYLETVGDIINMTTLTTDLPSLNDINPEESYLGFEISLASTASKEAIAEVFEFVLADCQLQILSPRSKLSDYTQLIYALPEENIAIGETLVASGALTEDELLKALEYQNVDIDKQTIVTEENITLDKITNALMDDVIIDKNIVDASNVDTALDKQKQVKEVEQQSVRVNAEKLGDLINLVGELVISSAHTELKAKQTEQAELLETVENLTRLVEEIRDATLSLRMVQIGDTFNRFKRVVRDLSKDMGKKIDLQIVGGDTELDKTVVEKISDPLMHLIRNSLDHGIEKPNIRTANGKSETATVKLEAYHDSGSIVIEITDDGAGLNPEILTAKAIENGIISANQQLTLPEIHRLIFAPGFSTAKEITNISGRGVGMDVVNKNIDALRGQISVNSELGEGTSFTIRLPLTLAIIDGFQVQVGQSSYVIPLDLVEECIALDEQQAKKGEYINLRGEVMPYIHLSEIFNDEDSLNSTLDKPGRRYNIVVVEYAGQKAGLVVDELLGEHQTVIKPLGKVFQNLKGISGATILGSGEVAMIIDVPSLIRRVV
ncbi:chemotaxis protein CheA [Colwellia sp. MB02u-18]|uniref:chemotaxis protein CheA n=1 Tax=unclassified Colwellia TaxID=196834 RepID=UPI0015F74F8E|nr:MULTISPECIES: chemotaxis protein CheA [unclassified Colwellia]MBA6224938.1 chemotaxis protein CheA [Colwellia sp. MB3u-45]MBA6268774.1 chemotaxis protein CheA [Colwellia sp. MB3u-43]MBA6321205.1 chemotaxis protein CheA [Colwellia sp. MB02u-19]MBA6325758.1 chemotaxis protein CheA [Colwellia sp. MB02u-18]MBA6332233.1 chemotaxis protein CheA [Colwellia sp. MB02u-12]